MDDIYKYAFGIVVVGWFVYSVSELTACTKYAHCANAVKDGTVLAQCGRP